MKEIQHEQSSASRQFRVSEDYQKLICFSQDHNPFSTETKDLQNIVLVLALPLGPVKKSTHLKK